VYSRSALISPSFQPSSAPENRSDEGDAVAGGYGQVVKVSIHSGSENRSIFDSDAAQQQY